MKLVRVFVFVGLVGLCASFAWGQGVTTSALAGQVTDTDGGALPGALVEAVHEPTGTRYSAVTQADGRFRLVNVRVGGPYTVSAALDGFRPQEISDVFTRLGETTFLDFKLQLETVTEVVTVVGESNPDRKSVV